MTIKFKLNAMIKKVGSGSSDRIHGIHGFYGCHGFFMDYMYFVKSIDFYVIRGFSLIP